MPYGRYSTWKHWPLIVLIAVSLSAGAMLVSVHSINYREMKAREETVNRSQANILRLLDFSSALQDALMSQRAYLVLGTAERYQKAISQLDILTKELRSLTEHIDQPSSQPVLLKMHQQVEKLGGLFQHITATRQPGTRDAFDPRIFSRFFSLMASIQDNLDRLRRSQNSLLGKQIAERETMESRYVVLMLLASLSALMLVALMSALMLRQQAKQHMVAQTLQQTKERLDLAVQGASDGIWDWNPQNNQLYLSPRLKAICGYGEQELASTIEALEALIHPGDLAEYRKLLQQYMNREIPKYEQTFRIRHKDGSWRWVLARGIALWSQHGKVYRMVGVYTDITSLKQLEEELRQAQIKADAENQAKSEFFSNISHEIRTPLNSIIGVADILSRGNEASTTHQEYVHTLKIAANSLLFLINDLLDLSKLEVGSITLERVPFSLTGVLDDALALARLRAREKNIALESALPTDLPPLFVGDPHRLGQIVSNLLSNAVKFTSSGGIVLTARNGKSTSSRRYLVEISVKDTGIGIPQDKQSSIFDKFTQSDSSITRRFGGTGLGLSICRELCQLMGGTIRVVSSPGKGSEFIVTLPLEAAPEGAVAPVRGAAVNPHRASAVQKGMVLLVEDYKPNVIIARTVLNDLGYECEVASSGQEALAILCSYQRANFLAVLMDIELPAMSGLEVTEHVRSYEKSRGLPHLPIIAITAFALVGDREKCLSAGMDDYISKPFNMDDLGQKLERCAKTASMEFFQAESA